jgi:hypothetical protein
MTTVAADRFFSRRPACSAVCSGRWLISSCSSQGVTTFTPSREIGRGKRLYGEMHGRQFTNSPDWRTHQAQQSAIDTEALIRGYAEPHFRRPFAFISLQLPRRTRHHARQILTQHGEAAVFAFLRRLFANTHRADWIDTIAAADYMASRRAEWIRYIATGVGNDLDRADRR